MARRRYGSITSLKLGFLPNMNRSVQVGDVLVGGALGIAGSGVVEGLAGRFAPSVLAMTGKFLPLATGVATGAALYYGQKKSARGFGHAIGAAAVGLALTARQFLSGFTVPGLGYTFSGMGAVTSVNLGGYGGFLVPDNSDGRMGGFGGFLVPDNTDARLAELGAVSMGADDDGIAALVG